MRVLQNCIRPRQVDSSRYATLVSVCFLDRLAGAKMPLHRRYPGTAMSAKAQTGTPRDWTKRPARLTLMCLTWATVSNCLILVVAALILWENYPETAAILVPITSLAAAVIYHNHVSRLYLTITRLPYPFCLRFESFSPTRDQIQTVLIIGMAFYSNPGTSIDARHGRYS